MGNKTVTPAKSHAPIYPNTETDHYTSVNDLYTDVPIAPRRSPTHPVSFNSPTFTYPVNSTIENPYNFPPMPTTSPTFAFPVYSPTDPIPMGSPTAPIPIESPSVAIQIESPTIPIRIESPATIVPTIKSPIAPNQMEPSTQSVPLNSPTPRIFVASPVARTPIAPSSAVISTNSPISKAPVSSPVPVISANSPASKVPAHPISIHPAYYPVTAVPMNSPIAAPVASSSPDIQVPSPIPNINEFPVLSPDTSAVSPTLDLNNTPVGSPVPPKPVTPVKPITLSHKSRSIARVTHDASTSPMIRLPFNPRSVPLTSRTIPPTSRNIPPISRNIPSTSRTIPATSRDIPSTSRTIPPIARDIPSTSRTIPSTSHPTEVAPKRTILKTSVQPPISILKQTVPQTSIQPPVSILKHTKRPTLSSPDRSNKWYEFEQRQQEEQKKFAESIEPIEPIENTIESPVSSPSNVSSPDVEIAPVIPDIIAVPSFLLRSTAVCNPDQGPQILSERTQSIHNDLSIFKYYVTYKEAKHSIGDHTKATMFKMDTRLKKTPLPAPCFSFLTKNFNDGTEEIKYDSDSTPSFETLGLQHDLEKGVLDKFPTEPRLHEKQQQRKLHQFSGRRSNSSDSNNSLQYVTSTIMSQADFPGLEQNSTANNRQPLTSILKKPIAQSNANPIPSKPTYKIFQEVEKTDFSANNNNNPITVSFKLPLSSLQTKANQSISRSLRLTDRKKLIVDKL